MAPHQTVAKAPHQTVAKDRWEGARVLGKGQTKGVKAA